MSDPPLYSYAPSLYNSKTYNPPPAYHNPSPAIYVHTTALPQSPAAPLRRSKTAALRNLAKTVAHPRRTRMLKKQMKMQGDALEETMRVRNIEEFLESGRKGPRRFNLE